MTRINNEGILRWQREHRPEMNVIDKRYSVKLRGQVLAHYGDRCSGCGTAEKLFVVREDGQSASPSLASGRPVWRWLRDQGWPDGYAMMCQRCARLARQRAV